MNHEGDPEKETGENGNHDSRIPLVPTGALDDEDEFVFEPHIVRGLD
ncbi:hypothetical protein [Streptomyces kebangsaanensis]|nr:hypothetical protein [Streptomyces kebangsaanensis]